MNSDNNIIEGLNISLTNLKQYEDSYALRYQEASKYDKFSFQQEASRILMFRNTNVIEKAINPYKKYASKPCIPLSFGIPETNDPLLRVIEQRRSKRSYSQYDISTSELYKILHFSYGITGETPINGSSCVWHYRAVPSGGALYPLEIYLYINSASIKRGLYHYRPDNDTIEHLSDKVSIDDIAKNVAANNIT